MWCETVRKRTVRLVSVLTVLSELVIRIVDKLSRLIPVCSLYFWYRPEICDILVGRVIKVCKM
jgi:hypothetical protein